MRLVTFTPNTPEATPRAGVRVGHRILDIEAASRVDGEPLPRTVKELLQAGRGALSRTAALAKAAKGTAGRFSGAMYEERAVRYLAPLPDPGRFLGSVRGETTPPGSFVGHDAKVVRPAAVERLACEPELVFVIGRSAEGLSQDDDWSDYVFGVTIRNHLTNAVGGADAPGFAPLGPEIITLDEIEDPHDLWMTCAVNGEMRTRVNTGDQDWKLGDLLARHSRSGPLEPGDMLVASAKGAAAPGSLKAGDVIECGIEGVATLRTTLVAPSLKPE